MNTIEQTPRITPFLWFDSNAEEAVDFYVNTFPDSRRHDQSRLDHGRSASSHEKAVTISFELAGQQFIALNGGPLFQFNESVSFVVRCNSQQEVDDYWRKLTEGGKEGQCGWLKDKFGLSWQIVPSLLPQLIRHPAALRAMLKMKKIDIAELERAAGS